MGTPQAESSQTHIVQRIHPTFPSQPLGIAFATGPQPATLTFIAMNSIQAPAQLTDSPSGAHGADAALAAHLAPTVDTSKAAAGLVEEPVSGREPRAVLPGDALRGLEDLYWSTSRLQCWR